MGPDHNVSNARGLGKDQLGGVIFMTNKTTINECLSKKLFGLPGSHFGYVKNIEPGLPLFLFNSTDRTLHGIFEAESLGKMKIDPNAWKSKFPAQVRVRVKLHGKVLTEKQFKPTIVDNYYSQHLFWFELDHAQTKKLLLLMEAPIIKPFEKEHLRNTPPEFVGGHLNSAESFPSSIKDTTKEIMTARIEDMDQKRNLVASDESAVVMNKMIMEKKDQITFLVVTQLVEKIKDLELKIALMEQNKGQAQAETKNLKGTCVGHQEFDDIKGNDSLPNESILLIGGYNGVSWMTSLDCYSPSQNLTKSLSPMLTERCYAGVSKLDGELFVFGGATRGQRLNTVESFNPVKNRWTFCPPLNQKNENLAGATLKDKIYALGGGKNDVDSYSSVEMLDFDVGAWIPTRSMLQKRFALAAAELHGALYAVGGFDGSNYLSSAERFDPRERSWKKIESMTTARGCPSMVVLNEKLFVLGGYDGNAMVSTVEIYDPRRGSWMMGEPMNHPRGFSAAAVAKDCVYIFGGLRNHTKINETVECYKEGRGWEVTNGACQRCFFSAITL